LSAFCCSRSGFWRCSQEKKLDTLFVSLSPDGPHATVATFSGEVPDGLRTAILRLPEQGDRVSALEATGLRE